MIKKKVNTELGRSMVEMLGTLAIMGVLTIGGIAGYRYAINKSNANTILNAVSQMAVTASTELTTQGSLTLPEWKDASGNLSISGAFGVETARYDDGAFGIIVSNMNDEVCERIKGMDWKVPEDVAINDESDSCDQGEANKIAFVFSNTLTKKSESESNNDLQSCSSQADCPYCHTCTGGKCVPDALCDNSCPPDKPVLTSSGNCISCNYENGNFFTPNSESECSKCNNYTYNNGNCIPLNCPSGYIFYKKWNRCVACFESDSLEIDKDTCLTACPNRTYSDGLCKGSCSAPGQFRDGWGQCSSCERIDNFFFTSCNSKCPNRHRERYYDGCVPNCEIGFGWNTNRCCQDNEIYIQTNTSSYGNWGQCCPKTRPNWNGSKCVP